MGPRAPPDDQTGRHELAEGIGRAGASVIRVSREPAAVRLEMLEHAVISAAATVYELNNTKQTRATMQYSRRYSMR